MATIDTTKPIVLDIEAHTAENGTSASVWVVVYMDGERYDLIYAGMAYTTGNRYDEAHRVSIVAMAVYNTYHRLGFRVGAVSAVEHIERLLKTAAPQS